MTRARAATVAGWLGLLALSAGFESLFVTHGINEVDEGWPLYAAMQLQAGGTLYRDVFFVFPPGHLLPAWIAHALDPPGLVLARVLYAGFNVALVAASYALGRRIMPAGFAWLGAALVAICSPLSHLQHLLFGYRYLVFSVLALLAFARRLRTGHPAWLAAAGVCTGVALGFRLTPAFAVACGIAAGLLLEARDVRGLARDAAWYAAGALIVLVPLVLWGLAAVGGETLWREIVVRPVAMTALQTRPMPDFRLPGDWDRGRLTIAFVAGLFRLVPAAYLAAAAVLTAGFLGARRRGERFGRVLHAAVVVWGAVYYSRALGRADEAHLASALPPFCLVLAWLVSLPFAPARWRGPRAARWRPRAAIAAGVALGVAWAGLSGADRYLPRSVRGLHPVAALDGRVSAREGHAWLDPLLETVGSASVAGDRMLILDPRPLLHVLAERPGPGGSDVLMPGTFLDEAEERAFVARLEAEPPALVLRPRYAFDFREDRAIERTAPRVVAWVEEHYRRQGAQRRFQLWVPRDAPRVSR